MPVSLRARDAHEGAPRSINPRGQLESALPTRCGHSHRELCLQRRSPECLLGAFDDVSCARRLSSSDDHGIASTSMKARGRTRRLGPAISNRGMLRRGAGCKLTMNMVALPKEASGLSGGWMLPRWDRESVRLFGEDMLEVPGECVRDCLTDLRWNTQGARDGASSAPRPFASRFNSAPPLRRGAGKSNGVQKWARCWIGELIASTSALWSPARSGEFGGYRLPVHAYLRGCQVRK